MNISMKYIKRIYYKLIPTYRRLELRTCTWTEGDRLIKENPDQNWSIAKEDQHVTYPIVILERKERITQ